MSVGAVMLTHMSRVGSLVPAVPCLVLFLNVMEIKDGEIESRFFCLNRKH